MFARLLFVITLLCCGAGNGLSEPLNAPNVSLGVYLKTDLPLSSLPLHAAKVELEALLAPAGIELKWIEAASPSAIQVSRLLSVEFVGTCDPAQDDPGTFVNHTALASTSVVDGDVLPFITVDCGALNRFLDQDLVGHVEEEEFRHRAEVYGRAVARLLAHEFYHVLAETQTHGNSGVAKTKFTVHDLMTPYLAFDGSAIARIRNSTQPVITSEATAPRPASSGGTFSGKTGGFYGKVQPSLSAAPEPRSSFQVDIP